ncbi:MAG: hypothetical protein WCT11_04075 [Candidatus Magasanikbacteria bacterium]|jgi:hypothetical protein
MPSGDLQKSLFAVWASISEMVGSGSRKLEDVLRWLQVIITRKDFISILDRPTTANVNTSPADWRAEWTCFYYEVFGLKEDFSGVEIKDDPGGFGWVVLVSALTTLNQVWAKCRDRFPSSVCHGDDLDRYVLWNAVKIAYTVRFRNRVEADEENMNLSADTLEKQRVRGITLLERMLLELWYHWRTGGGHLDMLNWTLCSGSRILGGQLLACRWDNRYFHLDHYGPHHAHNSLRTRSAV